MSENFATAHGRHKKSVWSIGCYRDIPQSIVADKDKGTSTTRSVQDAEYRQIAVSTTVVAALLFPGILRTAPLSLQNPQNDLYTIVGTTFSDPTE